MQLWLDMDGVLADFDKRARVILGMEPHEFEKRFGTKLFWMALQQTPDFYNSFEPMIDMPFLIDAVDHLNPKVLTGVPIGNWAKPQKEAWISRHLPRYDVITCFAREKSNFCKPGDILIDDRIKYKHLWEEAGGTFIVHTSAYNTIQQLKTLAII